MFEAKLAAWMYVPHRPARHDHTSKTAWHWGVTRSALTRDRLYTRCVQLTSLAREKGQKVLSEATVWMASRFFSSSRWADGDGLARFVGVLNRTRT